MNPDYQIVIVGAGFSGIGMAIRLKQNGFQDFVILERAMDLGGVWRDNSYPGCACDVESHLYSFSFAPNPQWSQVFSGQKEIWKYLRSCADQFDIRRKVCFGHDFQQAYWDQQNQIWKIKTSKGMLTSRFLIMGLGAFSEPLVPGDKDIPGLSGFQGKVFHSAWWDHEYDLKDRRVAVVGTGASAIQFIPEIQPKVKSLHIFQRTAPWVLPKGDRPIRKYERKLFEMFPALQKLSRIRYYWIRELFGVTFRNKRWIGLGRLFAVRHLKKAIYDPELQNKLIPNYTIGCKRVLLSNDYYPALAKKNVEVVTERIREVKATSIIGSDGVERTVDAIILGTGFKVTECAFAKQVYGKSGTSLEKKWGGSPQAFLGASCSGFPNLFFLLGPNTGLGHNSVVLMIEAQIEHMIQSLRYATENNFRSIEVRAGAEKQFIQEVDRSSRETVWLSGGCKSWYLDRTGRNSSLWPGSVGSFRRTVLSFRKGNYHVTQ